MSKDNCWSGVNNRSGYILYNKDTLSLATYYNQPGNNVLLNLIQSCRLFPLYPWSFMKDVGLVNLFSDGVCNSYIDCISARWFLRAFVVENCAWSVGFFLPHIQRHSDDCRRIQQPKHRPSIHSLTKTCILVLKFRFPYLLIAENTIAKQIRDARVQVYPIYLLFFLFVL